MVRAFALWIPAPTEGIRAHDLDIHLTAALQGTPLRWAITAVREGRLLIEGAVRL